MKENDSSKFRDIESEVWWTERRSSDALEKMRLLDSILQELGFKLTDFNSIECNLDTK